MHLETPLREANSPNVGPAGLLDRAIEWLENRSSYLAFGLCVLACIQQAQWVVWDHSQLFGDDVNLIRMSACMAEALESGPQIQDWMRCPEDVVYPPLIPAIAASLFALGADRNVGTAVLSLTPWHGILVWGLFRLGRTMAENGTRTGAGFTNRTEFSGAMGAQDWGRVGSRIGLMAAAWAPMASTSLHLRGAFFTEVPLMALTVCAVAALTESDNFRRFGPSVWFGICMGLGLLSKWTFAFAMGPTAVIAFATGIFALHKRKGILSWLSAAAWCWGIIALAMWGAMGELHSWWQFQAGLGLCVLFCLTGVWWLGWPTAGTARLQGMAVAGGLCLLLAGPWYLDNLSRLRSFLSSNLDMGYAGDPIGPMESWAFYPATLLESALGPTSLGLACVGLLTAAWRNPGGRWSLIAALSGFLALWWSPYRSARYIALILGLFVAWMATGLRLPLGGIGRRWGARFWPLVVVLGVFAQLSWLLPAGGVRTTLERLQGGDERHIAGNEVRGVETARRVLAEPRWGVRLIGMPPSPHENLAATQVVEMASRLGEGPGRVVGIVEGGPGSCLACLQGELDLKLGLGAVEVLPFQRWTREDIVTERLLSLQRSGKRVGMVLLETQPGELDGQRNGARAAGLVEVTKGEGDGPRGIRLSTSLWKVEAEQ
jgi:hypothetical protein